MESRHYPQVQPTPKPNRLMKILKGMILLNLVTYTVVYFVFSFIMWEFRNPFQWIIDIPAYDSEDRFLLLFFVVFYYVVVFGIVGSYYQEKKKEDVSS